MLKAGNISRNLKNVLHCRIININHQTFALLRLEPVKFVFLHALEISKTNLEKSMLSHGKGNLTKWEGPTYCLTMVPVAYCGCSVVKHPLCRNILDSCTAQPYGNTYFLIVQKISTCFNCIKTLPKLKCLNILHSHKKRPMEKKTKHTHIKENAHIFKIRILFYFEPTFIEISKNTDPELRMYKHNHINKRNIYFFNSQFSSF